MQRRAVSGKNRWVLLPLLLLTLSACQAGEQRLSFNTIARSEPQYLGTSYWQEEPAIQVIARPEEIDDPAQTILAQDRELAEQLRALDYERVFALLVLHGYVGSTGYSVTVLRIAREGDQVTVRAELGAPAMGTRTMPAFTSPYHLVAVSKKGTWGKEFRFVLLAGDQPVAERSHFIP